MKKVFRLFSLILLFVVFSTAQDKSVNSETPQISVMKLKWSEQYAARKINEIDILATKAGLPSDSNQSSTTGSWNVTKYFLYEATLKNETDKNVIGAVWDYVFYDPENMQDLDRHKFVAFSIKWKKNKNISFKGKTSHPPTKTINAEKIGDKKKLGLGEKVEIRCLVFVDKTYWKNTFVTDSECENFSLTITRLEVLRKNRN